MEFDYNIIILTEQNKDDFISWCMLKTLDEVGLDQELFLECLTSSINLQKWITQHFTWGNCYAQAINITCVIINHKKDKMNHDEIKKVSNVPKVSAEIKEVKEVVIGKNAKNITNIKLFNPKPTNIIERRELFASKYETKFKNNKFKKKIKNKKKR